MYKNLKNYKKIENVLKILSSLKKRDENNKKKFISVIKKIDFINTRSKQAFDKTNNISEQFVQINKSINLLHKKIENFEINFMQKFSILAEKFSLMNFENTKLVFIHIPKCGGTSIYSSFGKFKDLHHSEIYITKGNNLHNLSNEELNKYKFISGHFTYYGTKYIKSKKKMITFLRNPLDRLVSLYDYFRSIKINDYTNKEGQPGNIKWIELSQKLSFSEFCLHPLINGIVNNQYSSIFSSNNLSVFRRQSKIEQLNNAIDVLSKRIDCIGILEEFDKSMELIFKKLNLPVITINKANITENNVDLDRSIFQKIKKTNPDQESIDKVSHLIELDNKIYDFAYNKFKEEYKNLH